MPNPKAPHAPLTIRPATDADVPVAVVLESACFTPGLSLKERQLRYLRRRPSAVFLVAESAGRVVGEGIALVRRTAGPRAAGRIYSLAVDAEHRGQQVGQRLLESMVDALAARGVGRVYLEVDPTNGSAVALYHRAGFAPTRTLADYYGPGRHALHMACDLPPPPPDGPTHATRPLPRGGRYAGPSTGSWVANPCHVDTTTADLNTLGGTRPESSPRFANRPLVSPLR